MLKRILEAILFAADGPLTVEQIGVAIPDVKPDEITEAMRALHDRYEEEQRGWKLEFIAGGWQLLSHPDLHDYVERFLEGKRRARISRAGLETLAVVAYRQPITRGELEQLRGVDCGGVLHTLLERDLVTIAGRSRAIGRPLFYATTDRFLEYFGMSSLTDLPRLEEVEALWASNEVRDQLEAELERRYGDSIPAAGNGEGGDGNGNGDGGNGNGRSGNGGNGIGGNGNGNGNGADGGNGNGGGHGHAPALHLGADAALSIHIEAADLSGAEPLLSGAPAAPEVPADPIGMEPIGG